MIDLTLLMMESRVIRSKEFTYRTFSEGRQHNKIVGLG